MTTNADLSINANYFVGRVVSVEMSEEARRDYSQGVNTSVREELDHPVGSPYTRADLQPIPVLDLAAAIQALSPDDEVLWSAIDGSSWWRKARSWFSGPTKYREIQNEHRRLCVHAHDLWTQVEVLFDDLMCQSEVKFDGGHLLGEVRFPGANAEVSVQSVDVSDFSDEVVVGAHVVSGEDHYIGVGTGPYSEWQNTYGAYGVVNGKSYRLRLHFHFT